MEIDTQYYFVKRSTIVDKITFNHRTLYAKFERIDEPLNDTLISQHLDREYTIAIPLLEDEKSNYLLIEYRGLNPSKFYHLSRYVISNLSLNTPIYLQGKKENYIQLYISVDNLHIKEAEDILKSISDQLSSRLTKEWRLFPDSSLPPSYNIATLPYGVYS
ncbi:hypothetical protein MNB_SV-6-659 [hydrothermal vent metagenome]|uniref:DUF1882 domain-containing protein n=1 Tax=hydrothermal vent metagenome TaxID=652676 RepID=A0A1W1BQJ0_9ZZZZ